MSRDRRNSMRARRICRETHVQVDHLGREYMICACGCGGWIWPKVSRWRADHFPRRWAEGGRDTPDNLRPILLACDAGKGGKAAQDTRIVAHGKRVAEKHYGYRRRNRPMDGSRDSPWKKKVDGTVIRRW